MFNLAFTGVGTTAGSIVGAMTTGSGHPTYVFGVGSFVSVLLLTAGALTSDDLETNEYARVQDPFIKQYEEAERSRNPSLEVVPHPGYCRLVLFKLQAVWTTIQTPLLAQFFTLLFLQGVTMPDFNEFDYFFAIDQLGVSKEVIAY